MIISILGVNLGNSHDLYKTTSWCSFTTYGQKLYKTLNLKKGIKDYKVDIKDLKKIKKNADLILASNVFAHSDKLKEMTKCMLKLLSKKGFKVYANDTNEESLKNALNEKKIDGLLEDLDQNNSFILIPL